jgi:hypothetical protein
MRPVLKVFLKVRNQKSEVRSQKSEVSTNYHVKGQGWGVATRTCVILNEVKDHYPLDVVWESQRPIELGNRLQTQYKGG